jgi:hypothetical protein
MALMGLDTSAIAPLIVLATRSWSGWRRLALPAVIALPLFLVFHAAITVAMALTMPAAVADVAIQMGLILISVCFWLPVLGPVHRLSGAGRMAYLFLAMPTMDLAAVFVVLHGDAVGGLAMIVAMLPVGLVAVALAWQWMLAESADQSGPRSFVALAAGYPRDERGSPRP